MIKKLHIDSFRKYAVLLTGIACLYIPLAATAFQLSPSGTEVERHNKKVDEKWYRRFRTDVATDGIRHFTHPVHEEITQRIFDCDPKEYDCSNPDIGFATENLIAGVRWNDDPPFMLTDTTIPECQKNQTVRVVTQPTCWYKLFKHAEKRSKTTYFDGNSKRWNIMYRSHFGDLQFLHAMASRDNEHAKDTQARILMWAEFTWNVATGAIDPKTLLKNVPVTGFNLFFGHSGQNVEDMFVLGNPALRRYLKEVALGSLLHVMEDSFAFGHVLRDGQPGKACNGLDLPRPGAIRSFRSYANQDHAKHGEHDAREAMLEHASRTPNVIDIGKTLITMHDKGTPWSSVLPYMQCVFAVIDEDAPAGPGEGLGASQ